RRHVAIGALRQERPGGCLIQSADRADDREAERRGLRWTVPQLRERDPEFRTPGFLVARQGDIRDRVPSLIVVRVVEPVAVLLHTGRIDGELERGAPIVKRTNQHTDPVRWRLLVAARPD